MGDDLTGRINGWRCDKCTRITYCVHVDHGVTPMFLGCWVGDDCDGMAVSLMYPNDPAPRHVIEAVAWEWYAPTKKQARRLERKHPGMGDHIAQGGLALRELTDAGRAALAIGSGSRG